MRKLAHFAFPFSAAVLLSQYVFSEKWCLICGIALILFAFLGFFIKGEHRLRYMLVSIGLAAGLLWSFGYYIIFFKPAEAFDGQTAAVTAVVTDFPQETDYGYKVTVSVAKENSISIKTCLYFYCDTEPDLKPGNNIKFTARFSKSSVLHGSDTDIFTSRGYFLVAYAAGDIDVVDSGNALLYFPKTIAKSLKEKIAQIFPSDASALMQALIIGDTKELNKNTVLKNAMTITGVYHIVSVSGLHIAFLVGFISLVIRKKRLVSMVCLPVILFFMAVAGFSPPIVRAGVMQFFILTAPLFKRESDGITSLSAALMLILLANPFASANAGLQLSFAATLGLVLFTSKIFESIDSRCKDKKIFRFKITGGIARYVIASFASTVGALAFTLPLTALYFGNVSLIAPLTNLIVLWAVTLAFCGGFVACILGFIWVPLGTVAAYIVTLPAKYIVSSILLLSKAPFAAVYTTNRYIVYWLIFAYALAVIFLALRGRMRQILVPICIAGVSLCAVFVLSAEAADTGMLTATALNVGQGQSIVLTSGSRTAVLDCGSARDGAGNICANYIEGLNRQSIDLLILTHFHDDHANGVIELLNRMEVGAIAVPDLDVSSNKLAQQIIELAREKDIDIIYVADNMTYSFGNATVRLIAPIGSATENERGLTILCSVSEYDILVTGDMDATVEKRLAADAGLSDIEVYVAGHHGSKYSSSQLLLDAIKPDIAIISVGYNVYGQPAEDTIARLTGIGARIYRTDQMGNVTVKSW